MPDGEELERIVNDRMDMERRQDAVLGMEIDTIKKAVAKVENISGLRGSQRERA